MSQALTAFDKATFEFHEPELRIGNWDYDPISPDNSTILLESTDFKGKSLRDVYKDMAVPIVVFTSKCYQEIQYLTNKYAHQEWAVFLTMKKLDSHRPHFLAFDWFMPGQQASGGAVSVQAADSIKYYDRLLEKYPYYKEHGVHKFLCHLHSHHSMNMPNFSSIDDNQQKSRDDLGFFDDYRFYIVVTCNAGMKASMVSYNPAYIRTNAAVALTWSEHEYVEELSRKRKQEIDAIAEKALFKNPYVATVPAVTTTVPVTTKESIWTKPAAEDWSTENRFSYFSKFGTAKQTGTVSVPAKSLPVAKPETKKPERTAMEIIQEEATAKTVLDFLRKLHRLFTYFDKTELETMPEKRDSDIAVSIASALHVDCDITQQDLQALSAFVSLIGSSTFTYEEIYDILFFIAQMDKYRAQFALADKEPVCTYIENSTHCDLRSVFELELDQDSLTPKEFFDNLHTILCNLDDCCIYDDEDVNYDGIEYGHDAYKDELVTA